MDRFVAFSCVCVFGTPNVRASVLLLMILKTAIRTLPSNQLHKRSTNLKLVCDTTRKRLTAYDKLFVVGETCEMKICVKPRLVYVKSYVKH